jgi:organic radical activating enzyme
MGSLVIEPNVVCQLRCSACPRTLNTYRRDGVELSEHILANALKTKYFNKISFFFQGEPLLYRNLDHALERIKRRQFELIISTNGQNLREHANVLVKNKVDKCIVALDGTSQKTYEKYRIRGSLAKAIEGVNEVSRLKKAIGSPFPRLILQFILFEHNIHEASGVLDFAAQNDFDEAYFKTTSCELAASGFSRNELKYVGLGTTHFTPQHTQPLRNCRDLLTFHGLSRPAFMDFSRSRFCFVPVVLCDGDVTLCCWDPTGEKAIGHIRDKTLDDVLESERYRSFLISLMSPFGWQACNKAQCVSRPGFALDELKRSIAKMRPRQQSDFHPHTADPTVRLPAKD